MNEDTQQSSDKQKAHDQLTAAMRISQNASSMMDEAFAALLGINRTDARCLDIVQRLSRVTAGELARTAGLTTGAATVAIDRLEKAGYLRRLPDPSDRRKVWVEPTQTAHDLGRIVFSQIERIGREAIANLATEQIDLITRFLLTAAFTNRTVSLHLRAACARSGGAPPAQIARDFENDLTMALPQIAEDMTKVRAEAPQPPPSGWIIPG